MMCNFIVTYPGMTRDICVSDCRFNLVQWGDPICLESAAIVVPLGSESPLALQCDHPRWYSSRLDGCMGGRCEAIAAQSFVLVIFNRRSRVRAVVTRGSTGLVGQNTSCKVHKVCISLWPTGWDDVRTRAESPF